MSSDATGPSSLESAPGATVPGPGKAQATAGVHFDSAPRRWVHLLLVLFSAALAAILLLAPPPSRGGTTPPLVDAKETAAIETLLDRVHEKYVQNLARFDTNLKLQAVFILLGLLVLVRKSNTLKVAGTDVPLKWLHWLVPGLLLYLWLVFGFLLDDLIEGRHHGYDLLASLGRTGGSAGYARIFNDAGLIDGWFVAFVQDAGAASSSSIRDLSFSASTSAFLIFVLGILVAGGHAIIFAVLVAGLERYRGGRAWSWGAVGSYVSLLAAAAVLGSSHYMFAYGGANPNALQWIVVVAAPVLAMFLSARTRRPEPLAVTPPPQIPAGRSIRVERLPAPDATGPRSPLLRRTAGSSAWRLMPSEGASGRRRIERVRLLPPSRRPGRAPPAATATMLGDSLSAGFHLASPVETALRLFVPGRSSWFLDRHAQVPARDLVHDLAPGGELLAVSWARAMARVVARAKGPVVGRIAATWTLRRQVELWCERTPDAPSLVCVWIGHNDLDWVHEPSPPGAEALAPEDVRRRADLFEAAFAEALGSLVAHARSRTAPTAIVVFGLVNFRSFFRAREMAEAQRLRTPTRFPYLDAAYRYYPSMQPRYRAGMIVLADAFNDRIRSLVLRSARTLPAGGNVFLEHSPALSDVPIEDSRLLSAWDAWHPSAWGRASLAEAGSGAVRAAAEWLGMVPHR